MARPGSFRKYAVANPRIRLKADFFVAKAGPLKWPPPGLRSRLISTFFCVFRSAVPYEFAE